MQPRLKVLGQKEQQRRGKLLVPSNGDQQASIATLLPFGEIPHTKFTCNSFSGCFSAAIPALLIT